MSLNGIDTSNHQGKAGMNLDAVLKNGKTKFVICKATEGVTYTDPYMDSFISTAIKHGCLVAIYHYARADKGNSATDEANFFYKVFKKWKGKAIPVLDWEEHGAAWNAKWAKAWLDRIAKLTGSIPIFYSYESMINANDYSSLTKYPLWVAKYKDYVIDYNYDMSAAGNKPKVKWWDSYIMWQWTSSGRLDGYNGNLDCNVYYGTSADWKKLVAGSDPIDVTLEIAAAEVGYHEGANNHTKYGDEMHSLQPSNMDKNAPWCDCWCDWCIYKMCQRFGFGADMARKVLCGDFDDYTYASVDLYKKAKRWTSVPARGHQIFFGGSGHTGLVDKIVGDKVYTIEGNAGDEVRRKVYDIGDSRIIGYGMPRYDLVSGTAAVVNPTDNIIAEAKKMPLLKKGSKGRAVKMLQAYLGGLAIDGEFGSNTLSKVKEFQRKNNLNVDGEVGPKTWNAIIKSL